LENISNLISMPPISQHKKKNCKHEGW
jgi:hypothetical protein